MADEKTGMWARIENGVVLELTETDPAGRYHPMIPWVDVSPVDGIQVGWRESGSTYVAPPAPVVSRPTQITPLEFMARLTEGEAHAISAAAIAAPAILFWLIQCSGASYIDLVDPRTVAGVQALAAAGLLTSDRATALVTP